MAKRTSRLARVVAVMVVVDVLLVVVYQLVGVRLLYPQKYEEIVATYAAQNELPPSLVYAVIRTESHFNPNAESVAGAKGLMQLTDGTYKWIQTQMDDEPQPAERVFDPEVNIRCGCKVLQIVLRQFDNVETALAAYNAGIGNVSKWLKDPAYSQDGVTLTTIPFEETKNYVTRVLSAQEKYQEIYDIA